MNRKQYFVDVNGETTGPHSLDGLRTLYRDGSINDLSLCLLQGTQDWQPVAKLSLLPKTRKPASDLRDRFCTQCHTVARPKSRVPGSGLLGAFLWILALVASFVFAFIGSPAVGVLLFAIAFCYSAGRALMRRKCCPACQSPNLIPTDSPAAKSV